MRSFHTGRDLPRRQPCLVTGRNQFLQKPIVQSLMLRRDFPRLQRYGDTSYLFAHSAGLFSSFLVLPCGVPDVRSRARGLVSHKLPGTEQEALTTARRAVGGC
jgi:hypothetical protein